MCGQEENLRLQTELADALRKEAQLTAEAADARTKHNEKLDLLMRHGETLRLQVWSPSVLNAVTAHAQLLDARCCHMSSCLLTAQMHL